MKHAKQSKNLKLKELANMDIKDLKKYFMRFKIHKKDKVKEFNKDILSFEINEDFIKAVVGKYHKNKLIIKKYIKEKTPDNSINDGQIVNKEVIIDKLREIIKDNKVRTKYISFTTNSTLIINREMIIPKVQKDEIDTVVSFEISKYLPINLNDYILQTVTIEDLIVDGIEKTKVHTVCYPQKIARDYYDIAKDLNLKPYTLDIKFNSLKKLINYSQDINSDEYEIYKSNIFIDIGLNHTDIAIYKDTNLDFTRIIKIGYNNIKTDKTNTANDYDMDFFMGEIERIFQFYKNKNRGNNIDKVYLLGEGSRINDLDIYMSDKFSVPVESINEIGFVESTSKSNYNEDIYAYLNPIGTLIRL